MPADTEHPQEQKPVAPPPQGFIQKAIAFLKHDAHVPIGVGVFITVTVYHFYTHIDLGPNYVSAIWATYSFLGMHAGAQIVGKYFGGNDGGQQ